MGPGPKSRLVSTAALSGAMVGAASRKRAAETSPPDAGRSGQPQYFCCIPTCSLVISRQDPRQEICSECGADLVRRRHYTEDYEEPYRQALSFDEEVPDEDAEMEEKEENEEEEELNPASRPGGQ